MKKAFSNRAVAALLAAALLCAAILSGCSAFAGADIGYSRGMTPREKLSWGFNRLGGRFAGYLESGSCADLLGAGKDGGETETTLSFSGDGAGDMEGMTFKITSTENAEGDAGANFELDGDGGASEFGIFMVEGDLYLKPADASLGTVRLELGAGETFADAFFGLISSAIAAEDESAAFGSAEALKSAFSDVLDGGIGDDAFSVSDVEVGIGGDTVRAERVTMKLGEEAISSVLSAVLEKASATSAASETGEDIGAAAYAPGYYYQPEWGEWEYLDENGALYYYISNDCWYAYGAIYAESILSGCTYYGAGDAAATALAEDGVALFGPDTCYDYGGHSGGYPETAPDYSPYDAGYYYAYGEDYWYYFDADNYVWAYYEPYDGAWYADEYPSPGDFEFRAAAYSAELGCTEYAGFSLGVYTEPGYYLDGYGTWFYLGTGPGERGWYVFDSAWGWSFYTYYYGWADAEYFGRWNETWKSQYGLVRFGDTFFGLYSEAGYYHDSYGNWYHLATDGEYLGWYGYSADYGWTFFGNAYARDDLTYMGAYDGAFPVSEIGRPPVGLYRDKGYYFDGADWFYCDGYDGVWYVLRDPGLYSGVNAGWQYWGESYQSDALEYLGESTDECPAFDGVGSGVKQLLEKQLREQLKGAAFTATVDIYEEDVLGVGAELNLPGENSGGYRLGFSAVVWYSGYENYCRVELELAGEAAFLYTAQTGKGADTDLAGTFRLAADSSGGSYSVRGGYTAEIGRTEAKVLGKIQFRRDGAAVGSADIAWAQALDEAVSSAEGKITLSMDGADMALSIGQTIDPAATEVVPEGWTDGGRRFTDIGGLLGYLAGQTLDETGDFGYYLECAIRAFVLGNR